MIEVKNVTKTYGSIEVLKDVNLKVEDGDFISIVGPSGSGKTSFLNVIAGLSTPTAGETIVDGVSIYKLGYRERMAFRRNKFSFIFQTFNLILYLTAVENVEIPLYVAEIQPTKQRVIASKLLEKVGLRDRLFHLPSELSIGEQQRVTIARALANNASVILADEPTGNLDTKTGKELMGYVEKLNGEGVTVLLVTHDPGVAGFAKKRIRIIDGRIMS